MLLMQLIECDIWPTFRDIVKTPDVGEFGKPRTRDGFATLALAKFLGERREMSLLPTKKPVLPEPNDEIQGSHDLAGTIGMIENNGAKDIANYHRDIRGDMF